MSPDYALNAPELRAMLDELIGSIGVEDAPPPNQHTMLVSANPLLHDMVASYHPDAAAHSLVSIHATVEAALQFFREG